MKIIIKNCIIFSLLLNGFSFGQSTTATNAQNGGQTRFLGYTNNFPLYTRTNNITRIRLNGDQSTNIDGTGLISRNGYMGLGTFTVGGANYWGANSPFSQLHLIGRNGNFIQQVGYRSWMQSGITFSDNQDLGYFGLRQVGNVFDITEMVAGWADNAGAPSGPDDFVFRFFGSGNGGTTISATDLNSIGDLDGKHIARFSSTGFFGLGNTFGVNAPGTPPNLYATPRSLAHLSYSNFGSVWQQFTNRNLALNSGTGEEANDGLRIGIIGNSNLNVNGTAALYNQEQRAMLFSTNANTTTMNVLTGNTQERLRITSVVTPTHLPNGQFGIFNPGGLGGNLTRVSISHNPANPVTRPVSLLHLGYNIS
jgi:hypothetical protein